MTRTREQVSSFYETFEQTFIKDKISREKEMNTQ